jgi:hypothetical protein
MLFSIGRIGTIGKTYIAYTVMPTTPVDPDPGVVGALIFSAPRNSGLLAAFS